MRETQLSNVKRAQNCPKCKEPGLVIDHHKKLVTLVCHSCKYQWKTLSSFCKKCKKATGFVQEGYCSTCYGDRFR